MTDLEKEMHQEYQSRPRTGRRVDDAIKAAAIVAERHIDFLRTQASPTVASEGQGEANTCADCGRTKDEDGTCYSCEYGAMFGH